MSELPTLWPLLPFSVGGNEGVVNIGSRQNGREKAKNVLNAKHNNYDIINKIKFQLKKAKYKSSSLYGKGNAGKKILNKILDYKIKNTQKNLNYDN